MVNNNMHIHYSPGCKSKWWSIYIYIHICFPGGASGKESTCQCKRHRRHEFNPWDRKTPWSTKWQPTPGLLPGESHGQRRLAGYSPLDCRESDMTEHTQHIYVCMYVCVCVCVCVFTTILCLAHHVLSMLSLLHLKDEVCIYTTDI